MVGGLKPGISIVEEEMACSKSTTNLIFLYVLFCSIPITIQQEETCNDGEILCESSNSKINFVQCIPIENIRYVHNLDYIPKSKNLKRK